MENRTPMKDSRHRKQYKQVDRQKRIVAELGANASVRISDLAAEFNVSRETMRRDLDSLAARGLISRTYGGAVARMVGSEPSFEERKGEYQRQREAIARIAVTLLNPGEVVMLGPGTTTYQLARRLAVEGTKLMVITPSISAGTILASNPSNRVLLTPGDYDYGESRVCGPETVAFIEKFRADTLIFSATGIRPDGIYEIHSGLVWVERAMLNRVTRRVLLIDQSKFNKVTLEYVCPLSAIDVMVVDAKPTGELMEAIKDNNITLHVA
jgi:DeoR family transcriptional regulator, glycerol-3-phosphate regulon repressor